MLRGVTHDDIGKHTDTADYILSLQVVLILRIWKGKLGWRVTGENDVQDIHNSVSSAALLSPFVNSFACSLKRTEQGQHQSTSFRLITNCGCIEVCPSSLGSQNIPCAKFADHSVYDRDVLVFDVVYDDLANVCVLKEVAVPCREWPSVRKALIIFCTRFPYGY